MICYEKPFDTDDDNRFKYFELSGCAKFIFGVIFVLIAFLFAYYQIQKYLMELDKDEYRIKSIRSSLESMNNNDSRNPFLHRRSLGRSDQHLFESLAAEHETIVKKHPNWANKYPPIHRMSDEEFSELQRRFDEEWEQRKKESSATRHQD